MTGYRVSICALVAVLWVVCLAVPMSLSDINTVQAPAQKTRKMIQTWTRRDPIKEAVGGMAWQDNALKSRVLRHERLGSLTEDQRDLMSKQIVHMISELMNREGCFGDHPLSDRDYQGWMDFGRRSAEKQGED